MEINLTLLGLDGCIYHKFSKGNYRQEPPKEWLLEESNKPLLDEIEQNSEKSDMLIFAHGTSYQDKYTDFANKDKGGSLAPALPLFQNYFAKKRGNDAVFIEPFLMPDIYGKTQKRTNILQGRTIEERNLGAGESYKNILRDEYGSNTEKAKLEHASSFFDVNGSRVFLIYLYAHRAATLHPQDNITLNFYDRPNALNEDAKFFETHPKMLPENVHLKLKQYDGANEPTLQQHIKGTGKIDAHYDWSIRYLTSKFYMYQFGASEDNNITTVEELQKYHEEDHYHHPCHMLSLDFSQDKFELEPFMTMREEISKKLTSNPQLMKEAYTTADQLIAENILPPEIIESENYKQALPCSTSQSPIPIPKNSVATTPQNPSFLLTALYIAAAISIAVLVITAVAITIPTEAALIAHTATIGVCAMAFFYNKYNKKTEDKYPTLQSVPPLTQATT